MPDDRRKGAVEPTAEENQETAVLAAFDQVAGAVPSGQLSRTTKKQLARQLLVDLGLREADPQDQDAAGPS